MIFIDQNFVIDAIDGDADNAVSFYFVGRHAAYRVVSTILCQEKHHRPPADNPLSRPEVKSLGTPKCAAHIIAVREERFYDQELAQKESCMRDGSLEDVISLWIDRMIEERGLRYPVEDEAAVYFVLLTKAIQGLLQTHDGVKPTVDYRAEVTRLLEQVRRELEQRIGTTSPVDDMPEPEFSELAEEPQSEPQPPKGQHIEYWSSDSWRKVFYTSFNRWFWEMKDYAHAAGRKKSDFLRDLAEVWTATGASALVYYAKDDQQRWFETAQMLRHFADLVEQDGLRSLPWGRWGRYAKPNHRPKTDAKA